MIYDRSRVFSRRCSVLQLVTHDPWMSARERVLGPGRRFGDLMLMGDNEKKINNKLSPSGRLVSLLVSIKRVFYVNLCLLHTHTAHIQISFRFSRSGHLSASLLLDCFFFLLRRDSKIIVTKIIGEFMVCRIHGLIWAKRIYIIVGIAFACLILLSVLLLFFSRSVEDSRNGIVGRVVM